ISGGSNFSVTFGATCGSRVLHTMPIQPAPSCSVMRKCEMVSPIMGSGGPILGAEFTQVNEAARAGIETSPREGSAETSPAVHVDRLSGDGARLVGAEKKRRLRDFRRGLAAPLQD